jgi:hypothetical protein
MSDMDAEFTKWLVTLGVGGILAAFMFTFYRKDVKQYTELWRMTADQLMGVIKENTASNVKLIGLIESQERNILRKQDVELLLAQRFPTHHVGIKKEP